MSTADKRSSESSVSLVSTVRPDRYNINVLFFQLEPISNHYHFLFLDPGASSYKERTATVYCSIHLYNSKADTNTSNKLVFINIIQDSFKMSVATRANKEQEIDSRFQQQQEFIEAKFQHFQEILEKLTKI